VDKGLWGGGLTDLIYLSFRGSVKGYIKKLIIPDLILFYYCKN